MSRSNPICNIIMQDFPLRIREGFPTLSATAQESREMQDQGFVVSEVGDPINTRLRCYDKPFVSYPLRKARKNQIPNFIFGKMYLGEAFSAFTPRLQSIPAIGSRITIDPLITDGQKQMFSMFNYISCDFVWILHMPAPMGTAPYLEIFAPEFDSTTVTRGVKWKPAALNTISVTCPWSSDLSVVPLSGQRQGQPGGSIIISTLENNTLETVNTPLKILAYCCVTNVHLVGYKSTVTDGIGVPALNFAPLTTKLKQTGSHYVADGRLDYYEGEFQSDTTEGTTEVEAEGGSSIKAQDISEESVPIAPAVETAVAETPVELDGVTASAIDIGYLGSKWYDYMNIELRGEPTLTWTTVTVDPYKDVSLRKAGESMSLPWRRNVWSTGSNINGYITQLVCQINIPRPPQISGVLEVMDSLRASSRYLINFGSRVEVPIVLAQLSGDHTSTTKPRQWTNPWVRTDNSANTFRYRLIAINRTAEIANLNVRVMLRPAYARFNVPRKPIAGTSIALDSFLTTLYKVCTNSENFKRWMSDAERRLTPLTTSTTTTTTSTVPPPAESQPSADQNYHNTRRKYEHYRVPQGEFQADFGEQGLTDNTNFITPLIGERPEQFSVEPDVGVEEDINLDAFPVLCYSGEIDIGKITSIPIDLAKIIDKFDDSGAENPITQKFYRFANIIPKGNGAFGPVIGNYTVHFRLPTSVAGEVLHNCLPGDMQDEVALRIFGLSSLASIAGTAFSAIGGPLLNGIVNTAAPILSGAVNAIGGKALGGLADVGINAIKGITNSILPTPGQAAVQGGATNAISGDLPISRYPQFVKYVKKNFEENPIFPTLMLELRNFYEDGKLKTGKVPVSVFANMRNCINVERSLFDRTVYPTLEQAETDVFLPLDRIPFVFEHFIRHSKTFDEGSEQNINFKRFITYTDEQLKASLLSKERLNVSSMMRIKSNSFAPGTASELLRHTKLFKMCIAQPQR